MIACVLRSGGIYQPGHVQRLAAQAREAAPRQPFICLSDVDVPGVLTLPLVHRWPGWWSKLELFRPGVFPDGERVLYMDLDTTLVGPLDALLERQEPFIVIEDFYRRPPRVAVRGVGSGLMMWTAGAMVPLYAAFCEAPEAHMLRCGFGGDQRFIEGAIGDRPVAYWDDVAPGQVVSYKVHCRPSVPEAARVVCFHGRPKPWEPSVVGVAREGLVCQ